MNPRVSFEELLDAFDWMSAGESAGMDSAAYVNRDAGAIRWTGEAADEDVPEDIDDESKYVPVPGKRELDLGRPLVFRFVDERLPESCEAVEQFFCRKGAYSRFKTLLERTGQLDAWHEYEHKAIEQALREWCAENGLQLETSPRARGA